MLLFPTKKKANLEVIMLFMQVITITLQTVLEYA